MSKFDLNELKSLLVEHCEYIQSMYYEPYTEDYEYEDIVKYYSEYPCLKGEIPIDLMLKAQRMYNNEMLSAGWCGCTNLENLLEFLKKKGN